eukprot:TRINITY_DN3117_c0_g1_i1.p3 TRINITY_DN3117_c0_g1~~TRINITY_DN3117_c0_g1_i1.p3  ORF type:complete len:193 (+),score=32.92 TRINITY_DN3117_c0_g1_i1:612-1190(+)
MTKKDTGDKGACPTCRSCLLLSDDHGQSWHFGGIGQAGSRESQVVQVPSSNSSAQLYITERNMGPTPGHRMFASSHDGGVTMTGFGIDRTLITPVTTDWTGIVASVHAITPSTGHDSNHLLMMTLPLNGTARSNLTVLTSNDNGASWAYSSTLYAGLGGYTDLVQSVHGMGVIFENGVQTFSDMISFMHVDV